MKRLITFGCSFTDYSWPTWSDIIAEDLGCEYENWAMGGGGNQQIARRALYRMSRGFDYEDTVMIQWTSVNREDRWLNGRWVCEGSVALSPTYKTDFIERYWSWDNDILNTVQARLSTERMLSPWLKYQMAMPWGDDRALAALTDNKRITEYWGCRMSPQDELPTYARPFNGQTQDGHPDPQWWLNWVEQRIYPQFGLTIKPRTRQRVQAIQHYLESLVMARTGNDITQAQLQHEATVYCNRHGWRLNKVKPGSDALSPGNGSDVIC